MAVSLTESIFRAYDIRGIVGEGLDDGIMLQIGKAIATEALSIGETCLVVGADARHSSPAFMEAMCEGILSTGCDVITIGTVPTPALYFATHELETRSGVMITGSHNPKHYNGVKIVLQNRCLAADQITHLKDRILAQDFQVGQGSRQNKSILPDYIKRICADIHLSRPIKVVIDCGNGVGSVCASMLFAALGCQVVPLYCEADGSFPNHHPDPTRPENLTDLIERVQAENAELGIALDGDADRVGLVSATGRIIDADRMLLAFIDDILPDNPGATVIFDVKSSRLLPERIIERGGQPQMCKSGHSYVKQAMQASGALIGGEYSAHLFFQHRWYGFDDGLYAAARFLELMDKQGCSADDILDREPESVSTPELFVPVSEREKFDIMATLAQQLDLPGATINHLDGIRADFPEGWALVRASNTTPCLVFRFEASSGSWLENIRESFCAAISGIIPTLDLKNITGFHHP